MMNITISPIVITPRLQLNPISESDTVHLFLLRSNKEVNQFILRDIPKSIAEVETFMLNIKQSEANGKTYYWAITRREDAAFIGTICLWNISQDSTTAEVGYELMPEFKGLGYMNEALKSVISFAKGRKFKVLEAFTHKENIASIKLLNRNGFNLLPDRKDIGFPNNIIFQLTC